MTPNDAAKAVLSAALPPLNTELLGICQPIVQGMTQYSGALCDGYAAMGTEWLGFVNRRLHYDMSLAGRLAKCGSPQDLVQEWAAFMTMAAEDYRNEFTRLTELNSTASQRAISAVHANGTSR
jgi:Phasin protein